MRLRRLLALLCALVVNTCCLSFLSFGKPLRQPLRRGPLRAEGKAGKADQKLPALEAETKEASSEAPQVEFDLSFFGVLILALPLIAIFAGRFE